MNAVHSPSRAAFRVAVLPVLVALSLGVGGCAQFGQTGGNARAVAAATPASVTVAPGETIYDIARRYNVPLRDLIDVNGLTPPYALAPGRQLRMPQPRFHVVKRGDTLYGVSRQYRVDANELAKANALTPPYTVKVGQTLRLPGTDAPTPAATQVAGGPLPPPVAATAPPAIAAPSAAPPQRIASLPPPVAAGESYTPQGTFQGAPPAGPGTTTLPPPVPAGGAPSPLPPSLPPPPIAAGGAAPSQPMVLSPPVPVGGAAPPAPPPVATASAPSVQVETLPLGPSPGAAAAPVPIAPSPSAPATPPAGGIQGPGAPPSNPGTLVLPANPHGAVVAAAPPLPRAKPGMPAAPMQPPAVAPGPVPAQAQAQAHAFPNPPSAAPPAPAAQPPVAQPPAPPPAAQAPAAQPAAPPTVAAAPQAPVEPPARGGGRFLWPVSGPIVSDFGPKPDGLHNDGINIGAEKGAPVIAAENGVVAYSGNELRGYGNLLLVRHADGWVTAYAHLDQMLVERGARVRRGEKIGTVGQSGGVTAPQLHFEVRKGSRAVDPRDFLEKGGKRLSSASAPGDRQDPG